MPEFPLPGCHATPLSGYLSAVGIHRAVNRLLDRDAEGRWSRGIYALRSRIGSIEELKGALHERFEPESIISPWNSGAGFRKSGTRPTADRVVQQIRDSSDPRLAEVQSVVEAADRVIERCGALGIVRGTRLVVQSLCGLGLVGPGPL